MKKNGFTLVELLAVLVILGLLALIVTPIITKTLDKQKKEIFKVGMENVVKIVKTDWYDNNMPSGDYKMENGQLYFVDSSNSKRLVKTDGTIKSANGDIYMNKGDISFEITDNKYCAKYNPTDGMKIGTYSGGCLW